MNAADAMVSGILVEKLERALSRGFRYEKLLRDLVGALEEEYPGGSRAMPIGLGMPLEAAKRGLER